MRVVKGLGAVAEVAGRALGWPARVVPGVAAVFGMARGVGVAGVAAVFGVASPAGASGVTGVAGVFGVAGVAAQQVEARGVAAVRGLDLHAPALEGPVDGRLAELGRRLFHDPRLSRDRSLACSSCHVPRHRFADGRPTSPGVVGPGRRNAPSLLNAAYREHLFWDGRAGSLEGAVLMPIRDSTEMDLALGELVDRLARDPSYRTAFARAFAGGGVTEARLARALAAFVGTLRSGDSPVDRWLMDGDTTALPGPARRGYRIFHKKAGCARCHGGPLFTDGAFHVTGVSPGGDPGRAGVTGREEDRGRFRTPSLRDVALTAPYMHDGSLATLEEVVDFYAEGGGAGIDLDPALRPFELTPEERAELLAFLRALTGRVVAAPEGPGGGPV